MEEIPVQPLTTSTPQNAVQKPVQTPPPIEPQSVKKPFFSKTIIAVFIIVIMFILLPAGTYLFLNSNRKTACTTEAKICPDGSSVGRAGPKCEFAKCPAITPTPVASILPTLTASETANWETYTDSINGYSISYPKEQFIRIVCPNEELNLGIRGIDKRNIVEMDSCERDMRYDIEITTKIPDEPKEDEFIKVTSEPITVGGINGKKYISTLKDGSSESSLIPEYSEDIYLTSNKKYFIHLGFKDLQSTFDKMLSTFKFTGASPSPTCRPRPACLDATPRCLIPETSDMCPPTTNPTP